MQEISENWLEKWLNIQDLMASNPIKIYKLGDPPKEKGESPY